MTYSFRPGDTVGNVAEAERLLGRENETKETVEGWQGIRHDSGMLMVDVQQGFMPQGAMDSYLHRMFESSRMPVMIIDFGTRRKFSDELMGHLMRDLRELPLVDIKFSDRKEKVSLPEHVRGNSKFLDRVLRDICHYDDIRLPRSGVVISRREAEQRSRSKGHLEHNWPKSRIYNPENPYAFYEDYDNEIFWEDTTRLDGQYAMQEELELRDLRKPSLKRDFTPGPMNYGLTMDELKIGRQRRGLYGRDRVSSGQISRLGLSNREVEKLQGQVDSITAHLPAIQEETADQGLLGWMRRLAAVLDVVANKHYRRTWHALNKLKESRPHTLDTKIQQATRRNWDRQGRKRKEAERLQAIHKAETFDRNELTLVEVYQLYYGNVDFDQDLDDLDYVVRNQDVEIARTSGWDDNVLQAQHDFRMLHEERAWEAFGVGR